VPDVAEGGFDDGGLEDRGGGRNGRHDCGYLFVCLCVRSVKSVEVKLVIV
jgi:hypothetical protein